MESMLLKIKDNYQFCVLSYPKVSWATIVRKGDYKSTSTVNFIILLYKKTFKHTGYVEYICFADNKIAYFDYVSNSQYVEIVK